MLAKRLAKKQASSLERSLMLQEIYKERDATLFEVCIERMQFEKDLLNWSSIVASILLSYSSLRCLILSKDLL
jgi:hypothetical protein